MLRSIKWYLSRLQVILSEVLLRIRHLSLEDYLQSKSVFAWSVPVTKVATIQQDWWKQSKRSLINLREYRLLEEKRRLRDYSNRLCQTYGRSRFKQLYRDI